MRISMTALTVPISHITPHYPSLSSYFLFSISLTHLLFPVPFTHLLFPVPLSCIWGVSNLDREAPSVRAILRVRTLPMQYLHCRNVHLSLSFKIEMLRLFPMMHLWLITTILFVSASVVCAVLYSHIMRPYSAHLLHAHTILYYHPPRATFIFPPSTLSSLPSL